MAHRVKNPTRWLAIATLAAACALRGHVALAQSADSINLTGGLIPLLGSQPAPNFVPTSPVQQQHMAPQRAPFARLIENPDQTDGAPPFALTDQTGTIQRYVEPVPGIDLASHVGQVVTVRVDTGSTLLASQLELPPQTVPRRMRAADEDRYVMQFGRTAVPRHKTESSGEIEQVQYVDNDDSTVQLLPDDVPIQDGNPQGSSAMMPLEGVGPDGQMNGYADPVGGGMEMAPYGQPNAPIQYGPGGMMPYSGPMGGPCPNCGRYQNQSVDGAGGGWIGQDREQPPARTHWFADLELMWLRPQVEENALGKLSESTQLSPRLIVGFEGLGNLDGRVRYWHYDDDTHIVSTDEKLKFAFDVFDIEGTHRFCYGKSELTLAAGLRLAEIHLKDNFAATNASPGIMAKHGLYPQYWFVPGSLNHPLIAFEDGLVPIGADPGEQSATTHLAGLTLAGDGLTRLGEFTGGHVGLVYGGRLSILSGNWSGDSDSIFVRSRTRNDNVLVHELYGGVELARKFNRANLHGRILYEMQNWNSDVLADGDIESIGILGPAIEVGAEF
jgi:hypothetical protein